MKLNLLKEKKELILFLLILLLIVVFNSLASSFGGGLYYFFYQGIYGIVLSTIIPLICVFCYEKKGLNDLGIKPISIKSIIIALLFIAFSIGGQLINNHINMPSLKQMIYIFIPLIMTTFFEEFLFRGFFQIRFEKMFGIVPSIILSGLAFSLYHLGYPDFRKLNLLLVLFIVGMMFALSFKLANNNLLTSFLVNLPNAVLTYIINPERFPRFTSETAIVSSVTIVLILLIFIFVNFKAKKIKMNFI